MARDGMQKDPTWGVHALLEGGVPEGPLSLPQVFYHAPSGGKHHGSLECRRLRSVALRHSVDFRREPASAYCSSCANGPTDERAREHIRNAGLVLTARKALEALRHTLVEYRDGCTVNPEADTSEMTLVRSIDQLIVVNEPTWEQVARAEAIVRTLTAVQESPLVDPSLLEWMGPVDRAARALHAHLKAGAAAHTGDAHLVRSCVLDLMGTHPKYSSVKGSGTPDGAHAPDIPHGQFPALCTTGSLYGAHTRSTGFEGLLDEAWRTWRAEMRQTQSLEEARAAVMRATRIRALEPKHVPQLNHGTPLTEPQTNLWQWAVAEWRNQALTELTAVVSMWAEMYGERHQAALGQPARVVALTGWKVTDRQESNATTQVLAQLQVVTAPGRDTALLVAPGVVADWLEQFGVHGRIQRKGAGERNVVRLLGPAIENMDSDFLATALQLWDTDRGSNKLHNLQDAVVAAQGIHAA